VPPAASRPPHDHLTDGSNRGWWSNFDKYIVSLLKARSRRHGH
jgi:hypothetical protein